MHIASMKPTYLSIDEIPANVIQKVRDEGEHGEKDVQKFYTKEVIMEQDLATIDENIKVKEFISEKEKELGINVQIHDWLCFNIG